MEKAPSGNKVKKIQQFEMIRQPEDQSATVNAAFEILKDAAPTSGSNAFQLTRAQMTEKITKMCESNEQQLRSQYEAGSQDAKACKDRCCLEVCLFFLHSRYPSCVKYCVKNS